MGPLSLAFSLSHGARPSRTRARERLHPRPHTRGACRREYRARARGRARGTGCEEEARGGAGGGLLGEPPPRETPPLPPLHPVSGSGAKECERGVVGRPGRRCVTGWVAGAPRHRRERLMMMIIIMIIIMTMIVLISPWYAASLGRCRRAAAHARRARAPYGMHRARTSDRAPMRAPSRSRTLAARARAARHVVLHSAFQIPARRLCRPTHCRGCFHAARHPSCVRCDEV